MLVAYLGSIEPGENAMLRSIATLVIIIKKHNTEVEALAAYNGANIQNNNDQELAMEIEEISAPQNEEMSALQIEDMAAAKKSLLGALLLGLRKMLYF